MRALAFVPQRGHRLQAAPERNRRVDRMKLIQVDPVDLQGLQRPLAGGADVNRRGIPDPGVAGSPQADLGSNADRVPVRAAHENPGQKPFVVAEVIVIEAIHIGRVDEGDADVEDLLDDARGGALVRPSRHRETHRAISDGADDVTGPAELGALHATRHVTAGLTAATSDRRAPGAPPRISLRSFPWPGRCPRDVIPARGLRTPRKLGVSRDRLLRCIDLDFFRFRDCRALLKAATFRNSRCFHLTRHCFLRAISFEAAVSVRGELPLRLGRNLSCHVSSFNDDGDANLVGDRGVNIGFSGGRLNRDDQRVTRGPVPGVEVGALVPPAHGWVDREIAARCETGCGAAPNIGMNGPDRK